jgi:RNA polymerase sigma factor (sigma-70 family)
MIVTLSEETLEAARRGDAEARLELTRTWAPQVLAWCARLGCPDPEDAAHNVLVTVLTRIDDLRAFEQFPGWLLAVTRHEVARHRRRAWLRGWIPGISLAQSSVEDPAPGPGARSEEAEVIRAVREALDALPEQSRIVLVLCDIEDRSDDEAAGLLGIPRGTVKSRLRVARRRFAKEARSRNLCEAVAAFSEGRGV